VHPFPTLADTARRCGALREIAQKVEDGPIPLAAAHAADGFQQLSVIADTQNLTPADVERPAGPVSEEVRAARQSVVESIGNVDILLNLLDTHLLEERAPMSSRRRPQPHRRAPRSRHPHVRRPATNPVLH
jgi:hypothetical protein